MVTELSAAAACSLRAAAASSSLESGGQTQSSLARRPMRSWASMGRLASSSCRCHWLLHLPPGSMFSATSGSLARKPRPRASTAAASRSASGASPRGGTRWTRRPLQVSSACSCTSSRNSSAVVLTEQATCRSLSGMYTFSSLDLWLGGMKAKKSCAGQPAPAPFAGRRKLGASSMTSSAAASFRSTLRSGMESEVFMPCCTCKQMPKSSWKSAMLWRPRRRCSCCTNLKSSPMLTSSYSTSSPALRRKT
mmetsp:Transcript_51920/g.166213  ORF Transcript_51920/g.166213 Transcript_51920/m.166213 type:complete len:250 (+) Transcript_51920:678-1427(+)